MVGWSGSYTHAAGDQFYFKGGVTCPASYFPLTVAAGGSAGAGYDYYGPDPSKAWFTGGSWARPIWGFAGSFAGSNNQAFLFGSNDYVWADNFEVTGFADNNDNAYQHDVVFLIGSSGYHQKVTNSYFHAWIVTGATHDDIVFIHGNNSGNQTLVVVDSNYCNGADATPPSTSAGNGSSECIRYIAGGTITNNVMLNESNGIVFGGYSGATVAGNDCSNIWTSYDASNHENCFEFQIGGNVIYNNKVHDTQYGWPFVLAPSAGTTDWVFNNVCWNVDRDCYDIDTQGNFPTYTVNFYNNTAMAGSAYCIATTDRGSSNVIGAVNLINNHCITTAGTDASSFCFNTGSCSTVTSLTKTTNVLMTTSVATTQGYTSSETYAYSPTTGGSTIGAGTNKTASCSGAEAALCRDTTYSCSVSGGTLTCPARTTILRPSTGAWDAGAYKYQ